MGASVLYGNTFLRVLGARVLLPRVGPLMARVMVLKEIVHQNSFSSYGVPSSDNFTPRMRCRTLLSMRLKIGSTYNPSDIRACVSPPSSLNGRV